MRQSSVFVFKELFTFHTFRRDPFFDMIITDVSNCVLRFLLKHKSQCRLEDLASSGLCDRIVELSIILWLFHRYHCRDHPLYEMEKVQRIVKIKPLKNILKKTYISEKLTEGTDM